MKRLKLFIFITFILTIFTGKVKAANQTIDLWYLDDYNAQYISLPSGYNSSYQIPMNDSTTIKVTAAEGFPSISISSTGLVKPNGYATGKTTVLVRDNTSSYNLIFNVYDYPKVYADQKIAEYVEQNITSNMTDYEKMQKIGEFVSMKQYGTSPDYATFFTSGAGDCIATADLIINMAKLSGIDAHRRYAGHDGYAAGLYHRNVSAILDGKVYTIEGSWNMPTPRNFNIYETKDGFTITLAGYIYQYDGNAKDVVIPENEEYNHLVKETFYNGLYDDSNIQTITIPKTVTEIDDGAFAKLPTLKYIYVDEDNPNYKSVDGVLYTKDGSKLVAYPLGKDDTTYEVLENTKEISSYAFALETSDSASYSYPTTKPKNEVKLQQVILPTSLEEIGKEAFYGILLENLIIPQNVAEIGDYAFRYCDLWSNYIIIKNPNVTLGKSVFGSSASIYSTENESLQNYVENGGNFFLELNDLDTFKQITEDMISGVESEVVYNPEGTYQNNIVITDNGYTLVENKDYVLNYSYATGKGNGRVYISGIGDYIGSHFYIYSKINRTITYELTNPVVNYTEEGTTPNLVIPSDAQISYLSIKKNGLGYGTFDSMPTLVEPGEYSITFQAKGDMYDTLFTTVKFTIKGLDINDAIIEGISNYVVENNNVNIKINPIVKYNGQTLVKDVDYTLSGDIPTTVGTKELVITGIGKYSGTKKISYEIVNSADYNISFEENKITLNVAATYESKIKYDPTLDLITTYSTDNDKVATVDQNGLIKAIAPGNATITATAPNGKTAKLEIVVNNYLKGDLNKNGKIDLTDILLLIKLYFNKIQSNDYYKMAGDMNTNGRYDLTDILLLIKTYFGKI